MSLILQSPSSFDHEFAVNVNLSSPANKSKFYDFETRTAKIIEIEAQTASAEHLRDMGEGQRLSKPGMDRTDQDFGNGSRRRLRSWSEMTTVWVGSC
ncbi:hypothetical protein TNIN_64471 [Trichonephila inaurata madagascariensis]|uniref:Uncharacterized protein n=1 Tax=Trichonephila inaurata madagascariensis TaxID=2747483 RepID=A0A8X7CQ98_9ARAC|nr:hypothetical protein TNIN_64471 [Trichonephila inaurata madagascariensis]